jgi:hypothetical protein
VLTGAVPFYRQFSGNDLGLWYWGTAQTHRDCSDGKTENGDDFPA